MEYYLTIKRNKSESALVRWMNLQPVKQSEVSQKERNKYQILMHIHGIWKNYKLLAYLQGMNRDTDIEKDSERCSDMWVPSCLDHYSCRVQSNVRRIDSSSSIVLPQDCFGSLESFYVSTEIVNVIVLVLWKMSMLIWWSLHWI